MSASDGRATHDYSRGFSPSPGARTGFAGLRRLLLASALLGGVLLVAADASTLYSVAVVTVTKATVSGHAQHSYGLALVGLAALGLTVAAARRTRAAMAAIAVLGLAAFLIAAIAGDFHDVHSPGQIGVLYDGAASTPGPGFYFETLGGLLLVVAGGGLLLLPHGREPDDVSRPAPRPRPAAGPRRRPPPADPPAPRAPAAPRARPAPPPPAPAPERDPDDWFA